MDISSYSSENCQKVMLNLYSFSALTTPPSGKLLAFLCVFAFTDLQQQSLELNIRKKLNKQNKYSKESLKK